jgi:hypothetical protein
MEMETEAGPTTVAIGKLLAAGSLHMPKFGTRRVYMGELPLGPNPGEDEVVVLQFIINEQKDQINSEKWILKQHKEEADASSHRRASLSSHYSSSLQQRSRSHNLTRNLEAEFNEVDILPKTREAAIMAAAAYITANAPNDDEHTGQLRALALEGVRVLQTTNEQGGDLAPRRNTAIAEQPRCQLAAPAVTPRPQVAEPINGEL